MKRSLTVLSVALVLAAVVATPLSTHASVSDTINTVLQYLNKGSLAAAVSLANENLSQAGKGIVLGASTDALMCPNITQTLRLGSRDGNTNGQVTNLQDFLRLKGFLTGTSTGYFGSATQIALKAYQVDRGIVSSGDAQSTGYGITGPKTRGVMRAEGCVTTPPSTISASITSHVNGQTVVMDDFFPATTGTSGNYLANETFKVKVSGGSGTYKAKWSFDFFSTIPLDATFEDSSYVTSSELNAPYIFNDSGTWKITVVVTDDKGRSSLPQTITIYVAPRTTESASEVLYPKGGETVDLTQPLTVSFRPVYGATHSINLVTATSGRSYDLSGLTGSPIVGQAADKQSIIVSVPTSYGLTDGGQYKIEVCSKLPTASVPNCIFGGLFTVKTAVVTIPTVPVLTVEGQPTLKLNYDPSNKESDLAASFSASLTTGSSEVHILKSAAYVAFTDSNGIPANTNSYKVSVAFATNPYVTSGSDAYGQPVFIIPAGKTVKLTVLGSINPQQMFAGVYKATLKAIVNDISTSVSYDYIYASTNTTPSVTIVGERSPYITSIVSSSPNGFYPGGPITLTGVRFSKSAIFIDGSERDPVVPTGTVNTDTSLTFTIPAGLTLGQHAIFLKDPTTGQSNYQAFSVAAAPFAQPKVSIGYANLKLTYAAKRKESSLVGSFNGTIKADAGAPITLTDIIAIDVTGGTNANNVNGSTNTVSYSGLTKTIDSMGRSIYVLPAGKMTTFAFTRTINPQLMYAGSYTETLKGIYAIDASGSPVFVPFRDGVGFSTDAVTIVGESGVTTN